MKKQQLINCDLLSLIGKNVKGIIAQVRNPKYLNNGLKPQFRTLTEIKQFKQHGKWWIELHWKREPEDSCDFTGCTQESNSCMVQFTPAELSRMNQQSINSHKKAVK